jgi:hypothetical protein
MYYFESTKRFAVDYVDRVSVLGIFNIGIFEGGKMKEMKTLNLPTFIEDMRVYDSETRDVTLLNNVTVPCKVLKYIKDSIIMNSVTFEDSSYAQTYLEMIMSGSLPKTVSYLKSLAVWRKDLELNKVNLGVNSSILELILAVVHRNPNDFSQKFSKVFGKDLNMSPYDYEPASIRQICQYSSTFTAITFEDFDAMATTSLNRSRDGRLEQDSPIEKVIKM